MQAAHAFNTSYDHADLAPAAIPQGAVVAVNDNTAPRLQGDRWAWLIARLTQIHEPLGVTAWQHRNQGWSVERFCDALMASLRREYPDFAR